MVERNDGPMSATFWNPIEEELFRYVTDYVDELMEELYASGYPMHTKPVPRGQQYETLIALQQAGSPDYWQNQEAQDELRRLEREFGPAPPIQPNSLAAPMQQQPLPPPGAAPMGVNPLNPMAPPMDGV